MTIEKIDKQKQRRMENIAFNESRKLELKSESVLNSVKQCTSCKNLKTHRDFYFDFAIKTGFSPACRECMLERQRKKYTEDPKIKAYQIQYRKDHPELFKQAQKKYRADKPERAKASSRKYYDANKEALREARKVYTSKNKVEISRAYLEWAQANSGKRAASAAARRRVVERATPPWSDPYEIENAYVYAQFWSILTGIKQSVDHEIPLQGKLVSGLHVETNFRITPLIANQSKNNTFDPWTFVGP